MSVRSTMAWFTSDRRKSSAPHVPESFTVIHSADLDVHLAGVAGRPSAKPPWPTSSWDRHGSARLREPSDLARVMLDLHPAFVECLSDQPHWMQVEQAEAMAMEWVAAWFTPAEATDWLTVHPKISALRARELANSGLRPREVPRGDFLSGTTEEIA